MEGVREKFSSAPKTCPCLGAHALSRPPACPLPTTMNLDLHSHKTQLVVTALAASAVTAGLFSAYQQHAKRQKRRTLDQDILRSLAGATAGKASRNNDHDNVHEVKIGNSSNAQRVPIEYDEELVREQLARNYAFFGEDGMAKIRNGSVVVVGCGGVGSWAAIMLARS